MCKLDKRYINRKDIPPAMKVSLQKQLKSYAVQMEKSKVSLGVRITELEKRYNERIYAEENRIEILDSRC